MLKLLEDLQLFLDRVVSSATGDTKLPAPQQGLVHLLDRVCLTGQQMLRQPDLGEGALTELFEFLVPVDRPGLAFLGNLVRADADGALALFRQFEASRIRQETAVILVLIQYGKKFRRFDGQRIDTRRLNFIEFVLHGLW